MANQGRIQLTFVITVPPEHVAEGERIFRSHAPWMEATHPREGEKALLSYEVSRAPELSNAMDPSSEPTGNTCFVLTEVYESEAGVAHHFELGQESWDDFPALMDWLEHCEVAAVPAGRIVHSLW